MQPTINHALLALSAAVFFAPVVAPVVAKGTPQPSGPELAYRSSIEVPVVKLFELSTTYSLEEIEIVMNGQPIPEEYLPSMEMSYTSSFRIAVTDETLKVRPDGTPDRLRRTFDELQSEHSFDMRIDGMDDSTESEEVEGELQGHTVMFDWNDKDESYERRLEDEAGILDLDLAALVEDTDFRSFLPRKPVELGDSWDVDVQEAWILIRPGGELGLDGAQQSPRFALEPGELRGELSVRYGGEREVGGIRLAVLEIEAELEHQIASKTTLDRVPVADGMADETMHFTFEISGELLWDLESLRLAALELDGDCTMRIETVKIQESDQDPAYSQTMTFTGDYELDVSASRP